MHRIFRDVALRWAGRRDLTQGRPVARRGRDRTGIGRHCGIYVGSDWGAEARSIERRGSRERTTSIDVELEGEPIRGGTRTEI